MIIFAEARGANARRHAVMFYYGPTTETPRYTRRSSLHTPYCSEPYDEAHLKKWGYGCLNKHRSYQWPALAKEDYILIGDSLVKFVNRAKYMRVVAYPGGTAESVLNKMCQGDFDPSFQQIIVVAIGSNDVANLSHTPREITWDIMNLIDSLRLTNSSAMIAFSGILIRPKDIGTPIEQRRRLVNKLVQWCCNARGVYFMRSWKSLMNGSELKRRVYARDGLHLNRFGARFLYRYLEGNLKNIEGQMRL